MQFELNGQQVEVDADAGTLLDALRGPLHCVEVKDGCSPQGQCGCCTVLIDGQPRVSCVTPLRRVEGRRVTTLNGLDDEVRATWGEAFFATGASQCGFCSPGIIVRLEALRAAEQLGDEAKVLRALAAHVCRCTGYQSIVEAASLVSEGDAVVFADRDLTGASERASIEGHCPQLCGPNIAIGGVSFSDDLAPEGTPVVFATADGAFVKAPSVAEARVTAGKVQGRNTTKSPEPAFDIPDVNGAVIRLQTSWVEPAYVEPDASFADTDSEPSSPLGNGGAFGGKRTSDVSAIAASSAASVGTAVRVLVPREEVVRRGPKRPPLALALTAALEGVVVVPLVDGIEALVHSVLPNVDVRTTAVVGPPVSLDLREAVRAELFAAKLAVESVAAFGSDDSTSSPVTVHRVEMDGGWASVEFADGRIRVEVAAGTVLDAVTLRSYCIGAVHMGFGLVWTEGIAVDESGDPLDLTFRSFGLLRPGQLPPVDVVIHEGVGDAVGVSDAVFTASIAAAWQAAGFAETWPTGIPASVT